MHLKRKIVAQVQSEPIFVFLSKIPDNNSFFLLFSFLLIIVIYLSLLCRLFMNDHTALSSQVSAVLNSVGINNGEELFFHSLLRLLLDMFDKCDYRVGGVYHQKLW